MVSLDIPICSSYVGFISKLLYCASAIFSNCSISLLVEHAFLLHFLTYRDG
jgi:hypothetical protein